MFERTNQLRRFFASPIGEVIALVVLILIGTAMRLYRLGHESLWGDEYYTWLISSMGSLTDVIDKVVSDEPHPPLLFVMYYYFVRWLPEGDFWLRLPSAVAGVLSLPLLYAALRPWGRTLAMAAVALLVVSPMHIWYSQEARAGSFKVALELLVLVGVVRAMLASDPKPRLIWQLFTVGVCVIGLQLHFFFVFPASAALLLFLIDHWGRRNYVSSAITPSVLMFMLLLMTTIRAFSDWGTESVAWLPERYGPSLLFDVVRAQAQGPLWSPIPNWLAGVGMLPWLIVMGAGVVAWWKRDKRLALPLGTFLFFCLVLPVLISFIRPLVFYGQRHLVIAVPFVAAAIASGVLRWRWLTIFLIPVLLLQFYYLDQTWRYRQKHNYEGAMGLIEEQSSPSAPVIVVPLRLTGLPERYATEPRLFLGADSREQAAEIGAELPRPFWVLAFDDPRPALAERFPNTILDVGLIETRRFGQHIFVVRVN